jgi:hypothetical protein
LPFYWPPKAMSARFAGQPVERRLVCFVFFVPIIS